MLGQEDKAGVRVVGEHREAGLCPRVHWVRLIRIARPMSGLHLVTGEADLRGLHHAADAVFELGALMLGRGRRWLGLLTLDTRKFLEFFMQVRHFASFVTGLCSYSETKQTSLPHIK